MDILISSHVTSDRGRAEVYNTKAYPYIQYFDSNGVPFFKETFEGRLIEDAQKAAEEWVSGQHVLFG